MSLILLPAIDIAGGRTARAAQGAGNPADADPLEVALRWQTDGAEWVHLVDLDAAYGRGTNFEIVARVIDSLDINVELAGGIHDDATLERALGTGCERVSLGTAALAHRAWCERAIGNHADRIAISLDVTLGRGPDGSVSYRLAARGGSTDGGDLWETLAWLDRAGCARYIVTDVSTDGRLTGPNLDLFRTVLAATAAPIVASGGVASLGDLVALAELAASTNLEGAIVGTALLAGRFALGDALAVCDRPGAATDDCPTV